MAWLTKNLKQTATLWELYGTADSYGELQFSPPISIKVRWEDEEVMVKNVLGEQKQAKSAIYVDRIISEGCYIMLGTSSELDPRKESGARPVISFSSVPSLDGNRFERIAFI